MSNAYYGKRILGELSDAQTLPNATSADSTNMVYIGGHTNGGVAIYVYANNAVEIATGQAFNIELEFYTSDTAASAVAPFSYDNSGTQTAVPGHYYIYHKTSDDDAAAWAAGELITMCVIPEELIALMNYDYVQLKYTTDADESADKVDAFVSPLV